MENQRVFIVVSESLRDKELNLEGVFDTLEKAENYITDEINDTEMIEALGEYNYTIHVHRINKGIDTTWTWADIDDDSVIQHYYNNL